MTFASCLVLGASYHQFTHLKDLRINPKVKHETIQTWGTEYSPTMTKRITQKPKGFHADKLKAIQLEGLGIDHEEWKKSKNLSQ